ncbi:MAG: gamma-glutamyl-gamma-aminobutyrate hydrolase family protein [Deltaproteobacteria bacterium]|nr:gamma-glutamyl-gamma-aminobutyrate hydrolase family protein [Deltaproteobacteria bacterium]
MSRRAATARRGLRLLAFALGILLALPARSGDVVLLLTHPKPRELRNLATLVDEKLLEVPGLRVVGIHHAAEWETYSDSQRYLEEEGPDWMQLMRIDCRVSAKTALGKNGCRETFSKLLAESDGLILTGGPDIPPALYGQATRLTTAIEDPPRHFFELALIHALLRGDGHEHEPLLREHERPGYLLLGICLGMQSLNVALGGSLVQDIPSEIYGLRTLEEYAEAPASERHRSAYAQMHPAEGVGWGVLHEVRFRRHALTRHLMPKSKKRTVTVFSLHHQAVGRLAGDLETVASSLDGKVVEALVHKRFPSVFGVQFHPEKRILYRDDLVYREREDSPEQNFVHARLQRSPRARAFLAAFWKLISERLVESATQRRP